MQNWKLGNKTTSNQYTVVNRSVSSQRKIWNFHLSFTVKYRSRKQSIRCDEFKFHPKAVLSFLVVNARFGISLCNFHHSITLNVLLPFVNLIYKWIGSHEYPNHLKETKNFYSSTFLLNKEASILWKQFAPKILKFFNLNFSFRYSQIETNGND